MKSSLLFPLFAVLPLLAVEEAGLTESFGKMERGFNDYRFRTNTPEDAISSLHFAGEVLPETKERLKQVWESGKGRQDRAKALHAWMEELKKAPNSTDAQVYLAWQAAHIWFAEHGDREHDLLLAHIRHIFSSPSPTDSRHLMTLLYNINAAERLTDIGCQCDDFISLTDALNDVNPWMFEACYPMRALGYTRMDEYNRLWRDPVAYAPLYINDRREHVRHALHYLLNDVSYLHTEAKGKGLRRWRDVRGKDLPHAANVAMEAITERRNGNIPKAQETAKRIRRMADGIEPELLGCVPRCILAAAPEANAWKPLWDETASLYEMPDSTAVSLPGWDLKLLSKAGDAPDKVLQADTARLQTLLQQAADNRTLPALLAFTLYEDDLVLPDGQHRSWMGVDSYDTFRAVFNIELSPNFIDILIDEKGPHFSKDDAELRAACRELNLTLHRCIVALALLEQAGDTKGVQQGCAALAALLNRTKTWPLVVNEYSLRSISPAVFIELVSRCQGRPALLESFAEIAAAGMAYAAAEADGKGTPAAERVAHYLRNMMVLRRDLMLPEAERSKVALQWMQDAAAQERKLRETMEQYAFGFGAPEELLKIVPKKKEQYVGPCALRGLCLYRYAAEHGDEKTAEAIFNAMTADTLSYGYPATRLACALRARRQGREAEARRFEKDALILWMAEERYAPAYAWWRSNYAFLQAGDASTALADAVKLMNLNRDGINRGFFARAVPVLLEQGYGETASFVAEELLCLAMTEATPADSCGTQRQIVTWRALADIGHAQHLLASHPAAPSAKALMESCGALLRGDTAADARMKSLLARRKPLPKKEEPDGVAAAAAHDLAFESPEYVWHLKDGEGGYREVKGRIEYAWYENETESCWVRILTESGRREEPALTDIATEDIKHLLDWRKRNRIELIRSNTLGINDFHAKLCRLYSDAEEPSPETTRAVFLRPYGERRELLVSQLEPKQQAQLMKRPIEHVKPALRRFTSLRDALVAADIENRSLRLCFIGEKGGKTDKRFRNDILGNDETVREWNHKGLTLLCYRGSDGAWSAEAQEALRMIAPSPEAMLPAGSPLREQLEQDGFTVYIPRHQAYGNRKAKSARELCIDIRLKPLFVRKEAAALCAAAAQGKAKEVQRLLEAGTLADSTDAEGYPALYLACRAGHAAAVKLLLEHGADPQQRPLHHNDDAVLPIEAAGGNPAIVRLLQSRGAAQGGAKGPAQGTLLSPQVLLELLSQEDGIAAADEALAKVPQPIDWETPATDLGQTLLQHFVRERNVKVVAWLLEHGADANAPAQLSSQNRNSLRGSYPLFYELCCHSYDKADAPNNAALLELFLKHGADPNYTEKDLGGQARCPLGDCINCSRFDLALLLLQHGADGNITTGMTPVFYTLTSRSGLPENADKQDLILQVADALIEHGADPKQSAGKPWKTIKEHTFFKDRKGNYTTSAPLRAWMEKHL
ncbi:MAG: ankyrin repeat domain-containing protein [Akkermansia sp.]|nr:ankyrin repeat domain-containing protein [Akkermansia sp.]